MGLPAANRRTTVVRGGRRRRLPAVPGLDHERRWWDEGAVVAGLDEVGRGAWAGPLTIAAVVLPPDRRMYKLRDSKVLDAPRRQELATRIRGFALGVSLGYATNVEIERLGMSDAMRLAARRAVDGLDVRPDVCLLDGNWDFLAGYGTRNERIVHGDALSASIAAASIVAKVARDGWMMACCPRFPAYAFRLNKGYPSPVHQDALRALGPSALHRRTWAPVLAAAGLAPPPTH